MNYSVPSYPVPSLPERLIDIDASTMPIFSKATDYPRGHLIARHSHNKGQLIYASSGVMVVTSDDGQWVVPPTRAIWMPTGFVHGIRCVGDLRMRSLYVRPEVAPQLPALPQAVGVSGLLRELILAAMTLSESYAADSRDGRLAALIIDELQALPVLPLHLPQPGDARLRRICERLQAQPDDDTTLQDWALRLSVDVKTLQRSFARETGMTFGQWRQQSRLMHGLELLAGGEKVINVALALGYASPSAFATMFKRQFGQTPSEFFQLA
ncbi:helix-turn-helix transcriptional regulator [Paucibacter sp. R3-3]|uniref:Helix-turn-helix transcriptional regulator n=1 Tax=Roseateles agri TaxID=3098619 RepID=A0ABU5DPL2_9BURK|nr:helix-turn-helix transcriptional regulator [Paucibacter sp. R3-3]MDY0748251.1 helix-turn-helix transcriptional regulator [Paucibacter sp. R3-3]